MTLNLSLALSDNARTRPLLEGRVQPQGAHFTPTMLHPSEMFWRQLHFAEFDVSEMSTSSLLISAARGVRDWVALPVFTMRKFFHTTVQVHVDSGIEKPADLAGKRVGVPEYQQTWAVWSRGIMKDEFGVQPRDIEWFMERGKDKSHGGATGFVPPPGVKVNPVSPDTDIGTMLIKGELDATLLHLNAPNLVDRSGVDLSKSDQVRPLFADPAAEGRRYYAKTGIYPINHLVVVRRSLVEAHPWLALNLMAAFSEAKAIADAAVRGGLAPFVEVGLLDGEAGKRMDADPMPYGVVRNRKVLETVARYAHDQGLTDRLVGLEEIFAPSTLEL